MGRDRVRIRPDVPELRPQVLDVGIDSAVQAGFGRIPDEVEELVAAVDAARLFEKDAQQLVFVAREIEGRAEVGDLSPLLVEREGSWRLAPAALPGPPQNGFHAGSELPRAEGLDHIVVGPELQPDDTVHLAAARREKDDRYVVPLPDPPAHFDAAHVRQADVEDHQRYGLPVEHLDHAGADFQALAPEPFR